MQDSSVSIKIGKRTFVTAVVILAALMLTAGILTQVIPAGSYERAEQGGREVIVRDSFAFTQRPDFPVWRWLTAPAEVLWSADGPTVIVIVFFLLAIAGSVSLLERSAVLKAAVAGIVRRFMGRKYLLMSAVVFFFMLMGAVLGTFEENIALVPVVVALAYCLGWDSLVGLGMSMLASCFGFAAAITNPFSIAITQRIAELPLYSGSAFRALVFLTYYALVLVFLLRYAKKIERKPELSLVWGEDAAVRRRYASAESLESELGGKTEEERRGIGRAIKAFAAVVLLILAVIVAASVVPAMSDLVLPVIAVLFLVGSVVSAGMAGVRGRELWKTLGGSAAGIAPGIVLILMAMSVKFIISHGGIMDTILHWAAGAISATSPYAAVLLIYGLILVLELFVGSSSAKAFLIMPLIAPLSELVGITRQTSVLAFCFADGFTNVFYPTNPVLLICLGLTVVTFPKWFKWTYKLQIAAVLIAFIYLFIGIFIKLGPF